MTSEIAILYDETKMNVSLSLVKIIGTVEPVK